MEKKTKTKQQLLFEIEELQRKLQATEQHLREAIERERIMDSISSHEINSPLEIISSAFTLMKQMVTPKAEFKDKVIYTYKNIEEAIGLISITASQGIFSDPHWKPELDHTISILALVSGVANMLQSYAKRKRLAGIVFDKEDIRKLGGKIVDENAFRQVFYNLLSNAIKYSDENRAIRIYTGVSGWGSPDCINIENYGFGVSDDEKGSIFEVGYRGDMAKRKGPGHGKGLFIARKIMRFHNGDVILKQARNPTVFLIRFGF